MMDIYVYTLLHLTLESILVPSRTFSDTSQTPIYNAFRRQCSCQVRCLGRGGCNSIFLS